VTHVMRLGTKDALKAALQGLGLSGRLNTAFIERVNLTVRHGIAALARRTWATSQQSPHLLAHLEWWRAYYHGCRALTNRCEWRSCSHESEGETSGATLPTTYSCDGFGKNQPTVDGARGALLPITTAFHLRDLEARWELYHVVGRWVKVLAEALGGSLTLGRAGLAGLPHHHKPARSGSGKGCRFIHHVQWQHRRLAVDSIRRPGLGKQVLDLV
jgi:hypothetical protein